jgi:excisionase family DNA binding protein
VLLSVPKAARRLGVSRSMLYSLMARKQLPYVVLGRCRRIRLTALNAMVDACSRGAT